MKSCKKKHIAEEFAASVVENKVIVGIYMFVVAFSLSILLSTCIKGIHSYGATSSIADLYVEASKIYIWTYLIIPFVVYYLFLTTKRDFGALRIIATGSTRRVFFELFVKALLIAVCNVIYITLLIGIFGMVYIGIACNWDSGSSMFYLVTGTASTISLVQVVLWFMIISVFKCIVMQLIGMMIYWIWNSSIFALGIGIVSGSIELEVSKVQIFYNVLRFSYKNCTRSNYFTTCIIYMVISLFVLAGISYVISGRREFYNEK